MRRKKYIVGSLAGFLLSAPAWAHSGYGYGHPYAVQQCEYGPSTAEGYVESKDEYRQREQRLNEREYKLEDNQEKLDERLEELADLKRELRRALTDGALRGMEYHWDQQAGPEDYDVNSCIDQAAARNNDAGQVGTPSVQDGGVEPATPTPTSVSDPTTEARRSESNGRFPASAAQSENFKHPIWDAPAPPAVRVPNLWERVVGFFSGNSKLTSAPPQKGNIVKSGLNRFPAGGFSPSSPEYCWVHFHGDCDGRNKGTGDPAKCDGVVARPPSCSGEDTSQRTTDNQTDLGPPRSGYVPEPSFGGNPRPPSYDNSQYGGGLRIPDAFCGTDGNSGGVVNLWNDNHAYAYSDIEGQVDVDIICSSPWPSVKKPRADDEDVLACEIAIMRYYRVKKKINDLKDKIRGEERKLALARADLEDDMEAEIEKLEELEANCPHSDGRCFKRYTRRDSGPSTLQTIGNVALTLLGAGMSYKMYDNYSERNARLGWPTPSGAGVAAGYPFFMAGLHGLTAGGMGRGGYGCASPHGPYGHAGMMSGAYGPGGPFGYPPGLFGSPMGGGMYMPGMGPWGGNGPWGSGGGSPYGPWAGGAIGGVIGAMMGGPYGGGAFGGPFGMAGAIGAMMGGPFGGGPFGMAGAIGAMMGGPFGGGPFGMAGAIGAMMGGPYGMAGAMGAMMGGPMGGYGLGGAMGGLQMQQQMQQMQMQYQMQAMRIQQQMAQEQMYKQQTTSQLMMEMQRIQQQIVMINQGSYGAGIGLNFGVGSGGGINFGGQVNGGITPPFLKGGSRNPTGNGGNLNSGPSGR